MKRTIFIYYCFKNSFECDIDGECKEKEKYEIIGVNTIWMARKDANGAT